MMFQKNKDFKILTVFIFITFFSYNSYSQTPNFGICQESILPVRKTTDHTSEQVTQLLFGDAFEVLKFDADSSWAFIENSYDKYQGWIPCQKVVFITQEYYQNYLENDKTVVAGKQAYVWIEKKPTLVTYGSTLPFYESGFIQINEKKYKFEGKTKEISTKESKAKLLESAKSFLGVPYLWGGKSTRGTDCSGFTQTVFKANGYRLPRDSYQQAEEGALVNLEQAEAGDLAFFQRQAQGNTRVIHVGIYLGQGKIIHADGEVRINALDKTGIYRDDLGRYSHYLKFLKRF